MDKEIKFYVENDGTTVFTGYKYGKTNFRSINSYNISVKTLVYIFLKSYIDKSIVIKSDNTVVWVDSDFPREYVGSNFTYSIRSQTLQAKMSATLGIVSIVENAKVIEDSWTPDNFGKHGKKAARGWLKYKIRFGFINATKNITYFNGLLRIRRDENGKNYIYDFTQIKKETSRLVQLNSR